MVSPFEFVRNFAPCAGETYEARMTATPRYVNDYHATVAFVFALETGGLVHILRNISLFCTVPEVRLHGNQPL